MKQFINKQQIIIPVVIEKLTSIDGFVSKLSAKLQQAAFNNSLLESKVVFAVNFNDFCKLFCAL